VISGWIANLLSVTPNLRARGNPLDRVIVSCGYPTIVLYPPVTGLQMHTRLTAFNLPSRISGRLQILVCSPTVNHGCATMVCSQPNFTNMSRQTAPLAFIFSLRQSIAERLSSPRKDASIASEVSEKGA